MRFYGIDEEVLRQIEGEYVDGISSSSVLSVFSSLGIKFSEASLRKWVQAGLLPRSVRVGQRGTKHAGSRGMYPPGIVRQIVEIKALLSSGLTLEQIQQDILFVRGDLDELQRKLERIFRILDSAAERVDSEPVRHAVSADLQQARDLAEHLLRTFQGVEHSLIRRAEIERKPAAWGAAR